MAESFDKNMIDKDEYPQTAELERRCVSMVSELFNAPGDPVGASTIGSSEAVMLAGLAMKWRWRARRGIGAIRRPEAESDSRFERASGVGEVLQVLGCRAAVPSDGARSLLDHAGAGRRRAGREHDRRRRDPRDRRSPASTSRSAPSTTRSRTTTPRPGPKSRCTSTRRAAGFVAPFLQPHLEWDFRLPWVKSINVSGHKYGLTYPGIGFAIWRDAADLPEELVFHVNYLGGDMPTFTLNFSRPGNQIVGQYFNFIRLGRAGYTSIMETLRDVAMGLVGPGRRGRSVRAHHRWLGDPGLRGAVQGRNAVHGVRRVRSPAPRRMAGSGVHDARGRRGRRGAAIRDPGRASPRISPACCSRACEKSVAALEAGAPGAADGSHFSHT